MRFARPRWTTAAFAPRAQARLVLTLIATLAAALVFLWSTPALAEDPHGAFSATTARCTSCHQLHGAASSTGLLKSASTTRLCESCHDGSGSVYDTKSEFQEASATLVTGSRHPVPEGTLGCLSCHTPHRGPAEGNAMSLSAGESHASTGTAVCGACHGPASALAGGDVTTPYAKSAHASLESTDAARIACLRCHEPHASSQPALLVSSEATLCAGDGSGGCHSGGAPGSPAAVIQQFSASTDTRTSHDVLPAAQAKSGANTACTDCHNPHRDSASDPVSDPADLTLSGKAGLGQLVTAAGRFYVLAATRHDGTPPGISGVALNAAGSRYASPTVSWTTTEAATSWVDWGTDTTYALGNETSGSPFGSPALNTAHSVTMAGLVPGTTYHYRIRTADALGNTTRSADMTYTCIAPPPSPTLESQPDTTTNLTSMPITFKWSGVSSPDGDGVQYRVYVWGGEAGEWSATYDSGWVSGTSWTATVASWGNFTGPTYTWEVMARDAVHTTATSDWAAGNSFFINGPVESCPELYTWNGSKLTFVTDVMGLGPLGVKKGPTTYLKPEPVEDTVIPPSDLKAEDGKLQLRMANEKHEIEYVDKVSLLAVDHPMGTRVLINDLHWGAFAGGREPTAIHTIKDLHAVPTTYERIPVFGTESVSTTDVSSQVAVEGDGKLADSGLYDDNRWVFDLGELGNPKTIKLVLSGWMQYANKREKAAWIASGKRPPVSCMEVQDADGNWVSIGDAPHPANYTKTVVYDLSGKFPAGVTHYRVRMRIYMRMHLDYAGVDTSDDASVTVHEVDPAQASLAFKGVSRYTQNAYPMFFHDDIVDLTPGTQEGAFTRYGDVRPLLTTSDDEYVVMDQGDEISMSFDEPGALAAGMERTYIIHTDGYHQTQTGKVDPMPFHAMSNFPYGADEHYPDDAEHRTYLAEYETRIHTTSNEVPTGASAVAAADVFRTLHTPVASTTRVKAAAADGAYSLDTDTLKLDIIRSDGSLLTLAPVSASEASSSALPTGTAGGSAVPVDRLAAVGAGSPGVYLRTALATAEGSYDWQLYGFDVTTATASTMRSASLSWTGRGDPTPGHPTSILRWDPTTSAWMSIASADMPTARTMTYAKAAVDTTLCLKCHGATPPAGVTMTGVRSLAGYTTTTGDFHGTRAGTGFGTGGLTADHTRGESAIPCATCHDPHGSASLYHVPSVVNGSSVPTITTGSQIRYLCKACHTGTMVDWHDNGACYCHFDSAMGDYSGELNDNVDCLQCHGHNKSWVHVTGCEGSDCHGTVSSASAGTTF